MSLKINKILESYDEYSKIPKDEQKQNEWLGRHWMHVDGSVSKSNCFQKFLSKLCVIGLIFKKIHSIDIDKTNINWQKVKNDLKGKFYTHGIGPIVGNIDLNKIKKNLQAYHKEIDEVLKTSYIFLSFEAYIKKNSDPLIKDKVQSLEKIIVNFQKVKIALAKDIYDMNANNLLSEITKEFVALNL